MMFVSAARRYVLRNWMAQQAIERAEQGDYSEVNHLLRLLRNPYAEALEGQAPGGPDRPEEPQQAQGAADSGAVCELRRYDGPAPSKYSGLCVTCSS